MPAGFSPDLISLYRRLIVADTKALLPGSASFEEEPLSQADLQRLLSRASVLALSDLPEDRTLSYEIATRTLSQINSLSPNLVKASEFILSRLGNFPGRELLRSRYNNNSNDDEYGNIYLDLEVLTRESENTFVDSSGSFRFLTDFQFDTLSYFAASQTVSVSAPTSAGKS